MSIPCTLYLILSTCVLMCTIPIANIYTHIHITNITYIYMRLYRLYWTNLLRCGISHRTRRPVSYSKRAPIVRRPRYAPLVIVTGRPHMPYLSARFDFIKTGYQSFLAGGTREKTHCKNRPEVPLGGRRRVHETSIV